MQHDLKVVANNNNFNPNEFIAYAKKFAFQYSLTKDLTITTSNKDRLVRNFMKFKQSNRFLMDEDVLGLTHLGWKSYQEEMSGTVLWENKKCKQIIYATPNFDREGETPFDLVREGDEYGGDNVLILKHNKEHSVAKQLEIYLSALELVIKSI